MKQTADKKKHTPKENKFNNRSMNNLYRKGGGPNNKTARLTLRNPNYKNAVKNFSQNNPYFKAKANTTIKRISKLNSLRATKRNNKQQKYIVNRLKPAPKGAITAFKNILVTRRAKVNKANTPNTQYTTNFNLNSNKHNLYQEAIIERIPENTNSVGSYATHSTNNLNDRRSINSRSTTNTNSITNYKQKGTQFIPALVISNKNRIKRTGVPIGKKTFRNKLVQSWRGNIHNNNNNNDRQSISSYNEERWNNNNLD